MNISVKNKLFTSKLLSNKLLLSKKMLALALCVSLSANQAIAVFDWGAIKKTVTSFSFKNLLPQTKKGIITFLAVAGIAALLSIFPDATDGDKFNKSTVNLRGGIKKYLFPNLYSIAVNSALIYLSSPIAANINLIYIPVTIIASTQTFGNFLKWGKILTKNTNYKNVANWFAYAPFTLANTICNGIDCATYNICDGIDCATNKICHVKENICKKIKNNPMKEKNEIFVRLDATNKKEKEKEKV